MTRYYPRDKKGEAIPVKNEHDMMQHVTLMHDCTPDEWNFANGMTYARFMAEADDEEKYYVRLLTFPVGLFGSDLAPDSIFETSAECVACDTLVFARFRWNNPVMLGPSGRMGGQPVTRPDPYLDPEMEAMAKEDREDTLRRAASQEGRRPKLWTPLDKKES